MVSAVFRKVWQRQVFEVPPQGVKASAVAVPCDISQYSSVHWISPTRLTNMRSWRLLKLHDDTISRERIESCYNDYRFFLIFPWFKSLTIFDLLLSSRGPKDCFEHEHRGDRHHHRWHRNSDRLWSSEGELEYQFFNDVKALPFLKPKARNDRQRWLEHAKYAKLQGLSGCPQNACVRVFESVCIFMYFQMFLQWSDLSMQAIHYFLQFQVAAVSLSETGIWNATKHRQETSYDAFLRVSGTMESIFMNRPTSRCRTSRTCHVESKAHIEHLVDLQGISCSTPWPCWTHQVGYRKDSERTPKGMWHNVARHGLWVFLYTSLQDFISVPSSCNSSWQGRLKSSWIIMVYSGTSHFTLAVGPYMFWPRLGIWNAFQFQRIDLGSSSAVQVSWAANHERLSTPSNAALL